LKECRPKFDEITSFDEFNKKIDVLEEKNGYVWQVGVVLGSKKSRNPFGKITR